MPSFVLKKLVTIKVYFNVSARSLTVICQLAYKSLAILAVMHVLNHCSCQP